MSTVVNLQVSYHDGKFSRCYITGGLSRRVGLRGVGSPTEVSYHNTGARGKVNCHCTINISSIYVFLKTLNFSCHIFREA
jgi:hypothetical protein